MAFSWKGPWIVLCIVTGLNLCLVPIWAVMEGCNQISGVYTYRFVQLIVASFAGWIAIYLGADLWVSSVIGISSLVIMTVIIGGRDSGFIRSVFMAAPTGPRLDWRSGIFAVAMRHSGRLVGGYLFFLLFSPLLFPLH